MRKTKFVEGEFYHIYNRGNNRQEIFLDDEDHKRFQKLLYISNSRKQFNFRDDIVGNHIDAYSFERGEELIKICTYVLMPNHFHLFIYVPRKRNSEKVKITSRKINENPIPLFMRKLSMSYSKYFNGKYERSGSLFEGPFKVKHIGEDTYFKYLFSYIHLNPLKLINQKWKEVGVPNVEGAGSFLNDYPYSSFYEFFLEADRGESKIIDKNIFISNLPEGTSLRSEILDWIKYS